MPTKNEATATGAASRLRKWSTSEDKILVEAVQKFTDAHLTINYRTVAAKVPERTAKQCRERYENSLAPDVRRGEWSQQESIALAELMTNYAQNWSAIKSRIPNRTYNAIKKKGRKLLGEIVDRGCIPEGKSQKASPLWTEAETAKLLKVHTSEDLPRLQRHNYGFLTLNLRTGRSEAEVERQLLQKCSCDKCARCLEQMVEYLRRKPIPLHFGSNLNENSNENELFKLQWSLWKASVVLDSLNAEFSSTSASNSRSTINFARNTTNSTNYGKRKNTKERCRRISAITTEMDVETGIMEGDIESCESASKRSRTSAPEELLQASRSHAPSQSLSQPEEEEEIESNTEHYLHLNDDLIMNCPSFNIQRGSEEELMFCDNDNLKEGSDGELVANELDENNDSFYTAHSGEFGLEAQHSLHDFGLSLRSFSGIGLIFTPGYSPNQPTPFVQTPSWHAQNFPPQFQNYQPMHMSATGPMLSHSQRSSSMQINVSQQMPSTNVCNRGQSAPPNSHPVQPNQEYDFSFLFPSTF